MKKTARQWKAQSEPGERWQRVGKNTGDTPEDALRLVQELQVYQIELELQNEALKRSWAEVEAGLERYTDLYEFAPIGYLTLRRDGEVRQVNLNGARLLGQERALIVGRRFGALLATEERSAFAGFLERVFDSRAREDCEVTVCPPGAPAITLELTASVSNDGEECHAALIDITERKRLERLEHARRMGAQALVELLQLSTASESGMLAHALDSLLAITESKAGFLGLIDATETTMLAHVRRGPSGVGSSDALKEYALADNSLWARAATLRQAVVSNDISAQHAQRLQYPASDVLLDRFLGIPLVRDGRTVLLAGLANKNSEYCEADRLETTTLLEGLWGSLTRKRAETALKASEERHRVLFEASSDAIMTLTLPSGQFATANPATLRLFGARDEADFVSRDFWDCSPAVQPSEGASTEAREMMNRAMETGSHYFDWTFERLDTGAPFLATVLLSRVEIAGTAFLQATVRDVSELKRLQAQLAQTDRLATMGTLAAGVAHEINNPLTYILYNLESLAEELPLLAQGSEPGKFDDTLGQLNEALDGVRRISNIARSLGTLSRIEHADATPVDVNECVERAITTAFSEIRFRARLVRELGRVPAVLASEGKLAQIFLNLLINAAHSIDEGNMERNEIRVRTSIDHGQVLVEIGDTGRGIAPADSDRVYESFFTTKEAGSGSGLGLTICKGIVAEFGGEIGFTSEIGVGTQFSVRLPAVPAGWVTESVAAPAAPVPDALRGHILIVDDEPSVLAAMARILGRQHAVVTASSATEAQELIQNGGQFDAVFCDLMMPERSGMEFHAWLVERQPALAERLVFVTGGAFTPGSAEYLAGTRNRRLEKPFNVKAMQSAANELVRDAQAGAPAIS
jgi:PAS domain S-box-containing protein